MKKLSKIDESAWGDMMRRAGGETKRKEDDVNLLDEDDFISYLENRYTVPKLIPYHSSMSDKYERENSYSILLFDKEPVTHTYINIDFKSDKLQSVKIDYKDSDEDFKNKIIPQLKDNFYVEKFSGYNTYLIIKSKTKEINNKVVIDILDLVIDILDNDETIKMDSRINKKSGK